MFQPKLRFPNFVNSWESKKIGDFCSMQAGKFISASELKEVQDETLYPCYGGNGLRGFTKFFNYEGDFSLIGRQGAHCGNVTFARGRFYATEHAVVVSHRSNIDINWCYHLLKYLNLNQYSTGQAQPGLSIHNIEKIRTLIPNSLPEQQKIASFLSTVEEKINLRKKQSTLLETYKKGVMQKIFSREIRFKDEDGNEFPEWKEMKFGDFIQQKNTRNKENKNLLVLSISNTQGFILQSEQFENHRVASKNTSNYKIVEEGDVAYNPSRINVGSIAILKNQLLGIVSPMYTVFRLNQKLIKSSFFETLISTHKFSQLVKKSCSGSVRESLNFDDLALFEFEIPRLKEQQKISSFLSSIDDKIEKNKEQIRKMELWKKGLLQQMFI